MQTKETSVVKANKETVHTRPQTSEPEHVAVLRPHSLGPQGVALVCKENTQNLTPLSTTPTALMAITRLVTPNPIPTTQFKTPGR